MALKHIDLCAGTGAFTLIFESIGFETVYANDFNLSSEIIYNSNFKHKLDCCDLCNVEIKNIPKHDILTCGFNCQPFSIAGNREGFKDKRTNVLWKTIEIINFHKPRFFILENVKNLISHNNGKSLKKIIESLSDYHIKYDLLDTCKITEIPQHRERVFIVGFRNKEDFDKFDFKFPEVKQNNIREYLEEKIPEKYYYSKDNKIHKLIREKVIDENSVYQYRRVYVRENKNNVCPTLVSVMGSGGHNCPIILDKRKKIPRKLTVRECFSLQGFSKKYILPKELCDSKLYQLVGNAITVSVVQLIANKIAEIVKNDKK